MALDWEELKKREKKITLANDINLAQNRLDRMSNEISTQYSDTGKVNKAERKSYSSAVSDYNSLINSNADYIKSNFGDSVYNDITNRYQEHYKYSNSLTDSFVGYNERKSELDDSKRNARSIRRQALANYIKKSYLSGAKYTDAQVTSALDEFKKADAEVDNIKKKITTAKQIDKNNEEDERNQWYNKIVSNNAVSDLLSQAYNADSSLYAAGKQLENTPLDVQYQQNALGNNYASEQAYSSLNTV